LPKPRRSRLGFSFTPAALLWRCKTEEGWRRFRVKPSKNGRLKAGEVVVKRERRFYPEGNFVLRTYEGARPVYRSLGTDSEEAKLALQQETQVRRGTKELEGTGAKVVVPQGEKSLAMLRDEFMADKKLAGLSKNGISGYNTMFDGFFTVCCKARPAEVVKKDILRYYDYLRANDYADHTIFNRARRLRSFLEHCGVAKEVLPAKHERPKKPRHKVETYKAEELRAFFSYIVNVDEHLALVYEFMLKTGLREREVAFLEWRNLSFEINRVHVRNKQELGFRIKDCEERDVPLEGELKAKLLAWRETHGQRRFIFGTAHDKVEGHFLRKLKIAVRNARLNCGICDTCRTQDECEHWYLHKFRATFATTLIRSKVDLKTIQEYMGHADLEPTMRYLEAAELDDVQQSQFNDAFANHSAKIIPMPVRRAS